MTDNHFEPAAFRTALRAWLDDKLESGELTPLADDHSLDAHQAQHMRVLKALYDAD